jgi:sialidase-1
MRGLAAILALSLISADLPAVSIFVAGTLNHTCYRVPNAVRAPSGALLVFVEARGPSCDDQAPKDVMLSRSLDNGATWSPPEVVLPGWYLDGKLTFRNPYPVFTAAGLLLLQVSNTTLAPWFSLQLTSTDEGVSWSPPAPLAPSLGPFDGVLNGPGSGLLLTQAPHAGRLLTCGTTVYDTAFPRSRGGVVTVSDNAGASWSITQVFTVSPGGAAAAECQLAELRNGSVLGTFRNEQRPRTPCSCRLASRSDDGGLTWTPLAQQPQLVEPVCSAGLLQTAAGLFFSNPASAAARGNITVRKSLDGGATWPAKLLVHSPLSAGYSTLVPVGDAAAGNVGLVYEVAGGPKGQPSIAFSAIPSF